MVNKKWLPYIIAAGVFAVFIMLGQACATTPKVSLNTAEALKEYLDSQPVNTPDTPINIIMSINDSALKDVADILKSTDKYVNLNLSGSTITIIEDSAFQDCKSLTGITLPNRVTNIKNNVFNGCINLTVINMGSYVASLSYNAFNNCPNLREINVDYSNQNFTSGLYQQNKEGKTVWYRPLYNKDKTTLIRCPEGYTGNIILPDSVNYFAPYCFYQTGITSIEISGGIGFDLRTGTIVMTHIGDSAFINCTKLTSITISGNDTNAVKLNDAKTNANIDFQSDNIFDGNFLQVYKAQGDKFRGIYTTTAPVDKNSKWTKQ
jgi:hypothetical protein